MRFHSPASKDDSKFIVPIYYAVCTLVTIAVRSLLPRASSPIAGANSISFVVHAGTRKDLNFPWKLRTLANMNSDLFHNLGY